MTDPVRILVKRDELTLEVSKRLIFLLVLDFKWILMQLPHSTITGHQAIFCCSRKGGMEV